LYAEANIFSSGFAVYTFDAV